MVTINGAFSTRVLWRPYHYHYTRNISETKKIWALFLAVPDPELRLFFLDILSMNGFEAKNHIDHLTHPQEMEYDEQLQDIALSEKVKAG